jgi:ribosomal protein S15P/S13E
MTPRIIKYKSLLELIPTPPSDVLPQLFQEFFKVPNGSFKQELRALRSRWRQGQEPTLTAESLCKFASEQQDLLIQDKEWAQDGQTQFQAMAVQLLEVTETLKEHTKKHATTQGLLRLITSKQKTFNDNLKRAQRNAQRDKPPFYEIPPHDPTEQKTWLEPGQQHPRTWLWCATCQHWSTSHNTATHRSKARPPPGHSTTPRPSHFNRRGTGHNPRPRSTTNQHHHPYRSNYAEATNHATGGNSEDYMQPLAVSTANFLKAFPATFSNRDGLAPSQSNNTSTNGTQTANPSSLV